MNKIIQELKKLENPSKAKLLSGFFKTAKGEYGEGDIFLGITVPQSRELVKKFKEVDYETIQDCLDSRIHEARFCGLILLSEKSKNEPEAAYNFFMKNTKNINNWDLIDVFTPKIVGNYLIDKKRDVLYEFAKSDNLWKRRISIISCFSFINDRDFDDAIKISSMLLNDEHDLIHKAVGWMLREVGKKDVNVLEKFLKDKYKRMPRTMLRYAIEKLPENKRKAYLNGRI